jgi:hypothetical protein
MTKSGRHDYDNVRAARATRARVVAWALRATPRRALAWALLATTVVGAALVARSLVESAAQLRAAVAPAAAVTPRATVAPAPAVTPRAALTPSAPLAPPALLRSDVEPVAAATSEQPAQVDAEALAAAIERAEAAIPGPPSAYEFTRLVESGLLDDEDPSAVEELRRQLEAARAR